MWRKQPSQGSWHFFACGVGSTCGTLRVLARQRLFVEALDRGEFESGSPEADRYWKTVRIVVGPRDVADVPNWITSINMGASLAAVVLVVWGAIAFLK